MFKVLLITALCTLCMPMQAEQQLQKRVYLDENEVEVRDGVIYAHLGHNQWALYKSATIDSTGLYTYECNLLRNHDNLMEKTWKCPYCYHHWPVKTRCQNPDCPSRYM